MVLAVRSLVAFSMNMLSSFKVLNNLLVKDLLRCADIFSAGLSSGLYGGKKISAMLLGMINVFALWNALLSSTMILNSSGLCLENSFKYF